MGVESETELKQTTAKAPQKGYASTRGFLLFFFFFLDVCMQRVVRQGQDAGKATPTMLYPTGGNRPLANGRGGEGVGVWGTGVVVGVCPWVRVRGHPNTLPEKCGRHQSPEPSVEHQHTADGTWQAIGCNCNASRDQEEQGHP